jgi:ankyrin repeat protein
MFCSKVTFLGVQMGKTKVFLRLRAFEALEFLRGQKLDRSATVIQSFARMMSAQIQFEIAIYAVTVIQNFVRQVFAYRRLQLHRVEISVLTIQCSWRCHRARRILLAAYCIAWWAQSIYRGSVARQLAAYMFLDRKASIVQRAWTRYHFQRGFRKFRRSVVSLQNSLRFRVACRELGELRQEAKIRRAVVTLQNRHRSRVAYREMRQLWRKANSLRALVFIQNRFRSRVAFRELCELRREAKDLARVAAERDKFRDESMRLREELERERSKPSPPPPPPLPPAPPGETREDRIERAKEVRSLRTEVQRLQTELESALQSKASPTKDTIEALEQLKEEVAEKEDQLQQLRGELEALRLRDESFSIQSLTVESAVLRRYNARDDPPFMKSSPIRSIVSLLDAAADHSAVSTMEETAFSPTDSNFFPSLALSTGPRDANSHVGPLDSDEFIGEDLRQLRSAVCEGNESLVVDILSNSPDACVLVNEADQRCRTVLHLSSLESQVGITKILLQTGAIVNAQDENGETPLHLAETAVMTELLVKQGRANPNIPNIDGICALHLAVQRRDLGAVRLLLMSSANVNNADNIRWFTALHLIALPARNEVEGEIHADLRCRIAELLTGSLGPVSPDLDYQDREGNTPLHYAVQLDTHEACEVVGIFLEKGADPNICNARNQSPLHLLCHNSRLRLQSHIFLEAINTMLNHGADPNRQSLTGCTPLHLSLYHQDIDSAIQLVQKGADLHVMWKKVSLLLHHGICCGFLIHTTFKTHPLHASAFSQRVGNPFGMTRALPTSWLLIWLSTMTTCTGYLALS